MRLIIADEVLELIKQYKNELQRLKANQLVKCGVNQVEKFIKDEDIIPTVLTIPNNPTNGDMIKAMFPSCKELEILGDGSISCIAVEIGMGTSYFSNHWWKSPYKKEV